MAEGFLLRGLAVYKSRGLGFGAESLQSRVWSLRLICVLHSPIMQL